jgi:hypothetical protein
VTCATPPVLPVQTGPRRAEDSQMPARPDLLDEAPVSVACRFGEAGEWRPCRIVKSGPRSVTVEPWARRGELGRAAGAATIRLCFADGSEVDVLGAIRHRSWLDDEGRFGLGIECHGYRVSVAPDVAVA